MKPTEKQIHIYCTDDVHAKLKAVADSDSRSMSFMVVLLIERAYAELIRQSKNNLKG